MDLVNRGEIAGRDPRGGKRNFSGGAVFSHGLRIEAVSRCDKARLIWRFGAGTRPATARGESASVAVRAFATRRGRNGDEAVQHASRGNPTAEPAIPVPSILDGVAQGNDTRLVPSATGFFARSLQVRLSRATDHANLINPPKRPGERGWTATPSKSRRCFGHRWPTLTPLAASPRFSALLCSLRSPRVREDSVVTGHTRVTGDWLFTGWWFRVGSFVVSVVGSPKLRGFGYRWSDLAARRRLFSVNQKWKPENEF